MSATSADIFALVSIILCHFCFTTLYFCVQHTTLLRDVIIGRKIPAFVELINIFDRLYALLVNEDAFEMGRRDRIRWT